MRENPFLKRHRWEILLSLLFTAVSCLLYGLQILIFQSPRDTLFYIVQDISFLPIQAILVTLVLSELLSGQEKRTALTKTNIAIGIFFSEMGARLLQLCRQFDLDAGRLDSELLVSGKWTKERFVEARKAVLLRRFEIDARHSDLRAVESFLSGKRSFLLNLLENPNLLEHDRFTDMLWSVAHLAEELSARPDLTALGGSDLAHISVDMERAYRSVVSLWLDYMNFLRTDYPYLYSFALRTNPFDPAATVEILEPTLGLGENGRSDS